ncbi:MAG: Mpo1-like protein [Saprospiraceae bacterium]|nr:Mpo1-like protein [Saprospiraceae bacterium]
MAKTMQWFLDKYGESHQNATNKLIHWVCVPSIMFSLLGLIYAIPFPVERSLFMNWAAVLLALALLYYLRLSIPMFLGFVVIGGLILLGNNAIFEALGRNGGQLALISLIIFAVAWVGQFIGHKIEGKKPSFFEDVQFLLIGPAWLLHFIYRKIGVRY